MQRIRATRSISILIAGALVIGSLLGMGLERALIAQQPGLTRTMLQRTDDPGSSKYEVVMALAQIPPGASSGKHRHPGVEVAYVLEGSVVVEREGLPTETHSAGTAFKNEGVVHNAKNTGSKPAKILTTYIVEKGKPLAEPVLP